MKERPSPDAGSAEAALEQRNLAEEIALHKLTNVALYAYHHQLSSLYKVHPVRRVALVEHPFSWPASFDFQLLHQLRFRLGRQGVQQRHRIDESMADDTFPVSHVLHHPLYHALPLLRIKPKEVIQTRVLWDEKQLFFELDEEEVQLRTMR